MKSHPKECIGVVGLGFLGRGIASCFLSRGFQVIGFALTDAELDSAEHEIDSMLAEAADLKRCQSDVGLHWRSQFQRATDFEALRESTFIVESVPEDLATKESVLSRLESIVASSVVITSNTSAIPISLLQKNRKNPERFVGMHWAEPAHITRFLELIRGDQTSQSAFDAALAMGKRLGKDPIACQKDIPGFIVNRIAYAMYREACYLVEAGVADPETIDRGLRNSLGLWASVCGPFRWIDLTGGPTVYAKAIERTLPTLSNTTEVPKALKQLADEEASGVKNGRGFYDYTSSEILVWQKRFRAQVIEVSAMQDREFPIDD